MYKGTFRSWWETDFSLNNPIQSNSCLMGSFFLQTGVLNCPFLWHKGLGAVEDGQRTPFLPCLFPPVHLPHGCWLDPCVGWYDWYGYQVIQATLCASSAAIEQQGQEPVPSLFSVHLPCYGASNGTGSREAVAHLHATGKIIYEGAGFLSAVMLASVSRVKY